VRWLALLVLLGCEGAEPDPGLFQGLRVPGTQSVIGQMVAGSGPEVTVVDVRTPTVRAGQAGYGLAGRVVATAAAVHLQRVGDDRYWVVPTGLPDPANLDELGWSARLDIGVGVPAGPLVVRVAGVDAQGRRGPLTLVPLTVASATPEGALVITLAWDVPADLDLYVLDPTGRRLGPDDPTTYERPPPGAPPDPPDAWRGAGYLDQDAGAECATTGPLAEHGIWAEQAPSGTYQVSVDLAQSCGQPRVGYTLTATLQGRVILERSGVLYETDGRRGVLGGGSGVRIGEIRVP